MRYAQDIDIVIPMYNFIEYSDNDSKTFMEVYGNTTKMSQMIIQQTLNHLKLK